MAVACVVALPGFAGISSAGAGADGRIASVIRARTVFRSEHLRTATGLDVLAPKAFVEMVGRATPLETVVERGDPSWGTVHIIGQLHGPRSFDGEESKLCTARYQAAILNYLLAHEAHVLFVEGFPVGSVLPSIGPDRDTTLRAIFARIPDPEHFYDGLDTRQVLALSKSTVVQAAYRALRPGTYVAGADTSAAEPKVLTLVSEDSLVFEVRERVAMRAVVRYLERQPGQEVFLIFGAGHRFDRTRVPLGARTPRIVLTRFPGLMAPLPEIQDAIAELLENTPTQVRGYLQRLENVSPELFARLSASDQLLALDKPILIMGDARDPDALGRFLKEHARSPEVRAKLRRDGFRSLGP